MSSLVALWRKLHDEARSVAPGIFPSGLASAGSVVTSANEDVVWDPVRKKFYIHVDIYGAPLLEPDPLPWSGFDAKALMNALANSPPFQAEMHQSSNESDDSQWVVTPADEHSPFDLVYWKANRDGSDDWMLFIPLGLLGLVILAASILAR